MPGTARRGMYTSIGEVYNVTFLWYNIDAVKR